MKEKSKEIRAVEALIAEYANRIYPKAGDYETKRYGNDRMNEYTRKSKAAAVLLEDGAILAIAKPSIETKFCFSDEGIDYENYKYLRSDAEVLREYFMGENLKELDHTIAGVKAGQNTDNWPRFYGVFYEDADKRTAGVSFRCYESISDNFDIAEGLKAHERAPDFRMFSDSEREQVLGALEMVRGQFVKRLESWWKRYGAEKLTMWTYWANA